MARTHYVAAWRTKRLIVLEALVMAVLFCTVMKFAIYELQYWRCPADTFLWGSPPLARTMQIFALIAVGVGLGGLAMSHAALLTAPLPSPATRQTVKRLKTRRRWAVAATAIAVMASPVIVGASLNQFCLADGAVLYQPGPWDSLNRYEWDDVASITTSCARGRSGWRPSYVIRLRDGSAFDIMAWWPSARDAYPRLISALHGLSFNFDPSHVPVRCAALGGFQMLTERP